MNSLTTCIFAALCIQAYQNNLDEVFHTFDFLRGAAATLFEEAGALNGQKCMEDGDDLKEIVLQVKLLAEHFDIQSLISQIPILFKSMRIARTSHRKPI